MYRVAAITLACTLLALPGSTPTYAGAGAGAEPGARATEAEPARVIVPTCADEVISLQLVTDRHGVSTAAWECGPHVYAARTTATGAWTRPVDLAVAREPVAATDRRGRVTVAYRKLHGMGLVTRRWTHGRWQRPVELTLPSRADRVFVQDYRIAVNARGDTVVTWMQKDGQAEGDDYPLRLLAAFRPYDGPWGPTVRVDPEGFPEVALLDGRGRAMTLEDGRELVFHWRALNGTWTTEVSPDIVGSLAGAAENAAGDVLVTAIDEEAAEPTVVIHEKPAGQAWLPGVEVGTRSWSAAQEPVVIDDAGRGTVAYVADDGAVDVATKPADGAWGLGAPVTPTGIRAHVIRLASGPHGALAISWLQGPRGLEHLWVTVQPSGGTWSEPVHLTGDRWTALHDPQLSFRPNGDVLVAWSGHLADHDGLRLASRVVTSTPATR